MRPIAVLAKNGEDSCFGVRGSFLAKHLQTQKFIYDNWRQLPLNAIVFVVGSPDVYGEAVKSIAEFRSDCILVISDAGGIFFWEIPNYVEIRKLFRYIGIAHTHSGNLPRVASQLGMDWCYLPYGVDIDLFNTKRGNPNSKILLAQDTAEQETADDLKVEISAIEQLRENGWKIRAWRWPGPVDEHAMFGHYSDYANNYNNVAVYLTSRRSDRRVVLWKKESPTWAHLRYRFAVREDPMLEAQACGIPIVGVRGSAQPEMVSPLCDHFLVEYTKEAIVSAVNVAISDKKYSEYARKYAESFSWPCVVKSYWKPFMQRVQAENPV